jgi:hypothetical protein
MSNPYARTRGELQMAIAERIAAGLALEAVCAEPGMPCRSAVWKWTRAQPWFAELMTQARRRAETRRVAFDEAVGAAFVARVAAGERIATILADPQTPSHSVYRRWRSQQAHFAEELYRLQRLADTERGAMRARAHARPWDPALADRIYLRVLRGETLRAMLCADPTLPSRHVIARWRREHPEFDRRMAMAAKARRRLWGRGRCGCTPELTDRIARRVVEGASFAKIARARGMPSVHTLYAWKRDRPAFAQAIAAAREARADWCADEILAAAEEATPATHRAARRRIAALKRRSAYLRKRAERAG